MSDARPDEYRSDWSDVVKEIVSAYVNYLGKTGSFHGIIVVSLTCTANLS